MSTNSTTDNDYKINGELRELRSVLLHDLAELLYKERAEIRSVIRHELLELMYTLRKPCAVASFEGDATTTGSDISGASLDNPILSERLGTAATIEKAGDRTGNCTAPIIQTLDSNSGGSVTKTQWADVASLTLDLSQVSRQHFTRSRSYNSHGGKAWAQSWMQSFQGPPSHGLCAQALRILQDDRIWLPKRVAAVLLPLVSIFSELREPGRSGFIFKMVHGKVFQGLMTLVIAANVAFVTYDIDARIGHQLNPLVPYDKHAQIMYDFMFFVVYIVELGLRLIVHRMFFFINPHWKMNLFDFCVVLACAMDLCLQSLGTDSFHIFRVAPIFRLAKVLRVFHAIRFLHEVRLMLDSIRESLTTLFWCLVVIVLFLFVFSVMIMQGIAVSLEMEQLRHHGGHQKRGWDMALTSDLFGTVGTSLMTLFQSCTGGIDWKEVYKFLKKTNGWEGAVFVFYIAFFTVVAMNIITSTFLEKAARLAKPDVDSLLLEKHQRDVADAEQLLETLRRANPDTTKVPTLDKTEFLELLSHQTFVDFLDVRGIGIRDAEMFFDMLVSLGASDSVEVPTFINSCVRLKGNASSIDLQTFNFEVKQMFDKQMMCFRNVLDCVQSLEGRIQEKSDSIIFL